MCCEKRHLRRETPIIMGFAELNLQELFCFETWCSRACTCSHCAAGVVCVSDAAGPGPVLVALNCQQSSHPINTSSKVPAETGDVAVASWQVPAAQHQHPMCRPAGLQHHTLWDPMGPQIVPLTPCHEPKALHGETLRFSPFGI